MRRYLYLILLVFGCSTFAFADGGLKMRDMFASMPDSIVPMMTKNNRLDCIDFIENEMEAKVRNKLDQFVELKKLTSDYLLLETSEVSWVEMKFVASSDSTGIIYLVRSCKGPATDSHVLCFDQDWKPVQNGVQRPAVESFFNLDKVDDKQKNTLQDAILMLKDLTFLEARLSDADTTLTWTIGLEELSKDERKVALQFVQPVKCSLR